jgi:broad specificity phosphatase PhoE
MLRPEPTKPHGFAACGLNQGPPKVRPGTSARMRAQLGTDQARELGEQAFEVLLTSPLSRAAETCRLAGLGDHAEERHQLVEWNYGEYEGLTTPQIREAIPGWNLWRDGCPGGETADEVGARVDPLITELQALSGDAALFAHGHLLRVLTVRRIGLRPNMGACLALSTAAVSMLGYERETPVVWLWNEVGQGTWLGE